jgi:citrate synthase
MGILVSTIAALSTFYPEAKAVSDKSSQAGQVARLIANMPTLAAFAYRHASACRRPAPTTSCPVRATSST